MFSSPAPSLSATLEYVEEKTNVDSVFVNFPINRQDRGGDLLSFLAVGALADGGSLPFAGVPLTPTFLGHLGIFFSLKKKIRAPRFLLHEVIPELAGRSCREGQVRRRSLGEMSQNPCQE